MRLMNGILIFVIGSTKLGKTWAKLGNMTQGYRGHKSAAVHAAKQRWDSNPPVVISVQWHLYIQALPGPNVSQLQV